MHLPRFALLLLAFALLSPLTSLLGQGPSLHYVFLRDKAPADPAFLASFHPDALQRRAQAGIAFPAHDDLPLRADQCAEVAAIVDSMRHALRWIGALSVQATPEQVRRLRKLPFVTHVEPFETEVLHIASLPDLPLPAEDSTKLSRLHDTVRHLMHLDTLVKMGLSGKGIRIAVLDAGFTGADEHPGFQHLREGGRIALTHDFYGGKGEDVYYGSGHGTSVLGCIAGITAYGQVGAAPGATFLLARTEHNRKEKAIEEDHWMAAAEWADQNGARIISSSLGYGKKRYTVNQMDGRTAPVSRAAATAVRKGILVVNAAGNEGSNAKFRMITAPADADSVLTVGASYPMVRFAMPFTSPGPSATGLLKPEIAAPGYVATTGKNGGTTIMPGTSFACPLVSGVAACLMEAEPGLSNMDVRNRIIHAGHCYPYYDFRLGFGVLDARYLFRPHPVVPPTFSTTRAGDSLVFLPDTLILRKLANPNGIPLYIAHLNDKGEVVAYTAERIKLGQQRLALALLKGRAKRIRLWWEGYMKEEEY